MFRTKNIPVAEASEVKKVEYKDLYIPIIWGIWQEPSSYGVYSTEAEALITINKTPEVMEAVIVHYRHPIKR